jgi:hypothetical protein
MPAIAWNRFMTAALQGVAPVDLPGNYRFQDPGNFGPTPPAAIGGDGAPIALAPDADGRDQVAEMIDRGWTDDDLSGGASQPQRKRNFLQRLFGG